MNSERRRGSPHTQPPLLLIFDNDSESSSESSSAASSYANPEIQNALDDHHHLYSRPVSVATSNNSPTTSTTRDKTATTTMVPHEIHSPCCCERLQPLQQLDLIYKLFEEVQRNKSEIQQVKTLYTRTTTRVRTLETIQNQQSSEILLLKSNVEGLKTELGAAQALNQKLESHIQTEKRTFQNIAESVERSKFHQKQMSSAVDEAVCELETTKESLHLQSLILQQTMEELHQTRQELSETGAALRRTANAHENTRNMVSEQNSLLLETQAQLEAQRSELKSDLTQLHAEFKAGARKEEHFGELKENIEELSSALTLSRIAQTNSRKLIMEQGTRLDECYGEVSELNSKWDLLSKLSKQLRVDFDILKSDLNIKFKNYETALAIVKNNQVEARSKLQGQDDRISRLSSQCYYSHSEVKSWLQSSQALVQEFSNVNSKLTNIDSIIKISTDEFLKTKWGLTDVITRLERTYDDQMCLMEKNILDLRGSLDIFKNNPVPRCFLYTQLSGQEEPSKLWPTVSWEDVTAVYAGLFFRALGGSSRSFDKIQPEGLPRIGTITFGPSENKKAPSNKVHIPQAQGMSHTLIAAAGAAAGSSSSVSSPARTTGYQFHVEGSEVRPRNQAVKIWKRC